MLTKDVRARSASPGHTSSTAALGFESTVPRLSVETNKLNSGYEVIVANNGTVAVANTNATLTGGLFMLNSTSERIGEGDSMADYDDVGTLSPGSSRRYTVIVPPGRPRLRASPSQQTGSIRSRSASEASSDDEVQRTAAGHRRSRR